MREKGGQARGVQAGKGGGLLCARVDLWRVINRSKIKKLSFLEGMSSIVFDGI